jgi:hypothetical protein
MTCRYGAQLNPSPAPFASVSPSAVLFFACTHLHPVGYLLVVRTGTAATYFGWWLHRRHMTLLTTPHNSHYTHH